MKEFIATIVDGIKSLMQPLITFVAIAIFFTMSMAGQFPAGDVYKVVVGVLLFWFGYTAIKSFNFNGNGKSNGNGTSPKADSPVSQGATITCPSCGKQVSADLKWCDNNNCNAFLRPETPEAETESYSPFNATDFAKVVNEAVTHTLSITPSKGDTPSTHFYEAWNAGWEVYDPKDPEWAATLRKYANDYFASIWGLFNKDGSCMDDAFIYATDHLNDDKGCTTCPRGKSCTYPDLEFKALQMGEGYKVAYDWVVYIEKYLAGE